MFSIITTILEIIIAASSLIIAIVQVKAAHAKHRETKIKNERIRVLVQNITLVKDEEEFSESLNSLQKRLIAYMKAFTKKETFEEKLKIYTADYETINALYKELLIFEKEFSMSYGFGRYIDFFRKYLPSYEKLISEVENELSQGTIKLDVVEQKMIDLGEMRKQIEVYVQELRYKFSASFF